MASPSPSPSPSPTPTSSIPKLTTIFRPPASCTNVVTYNGDHLWQGELFEAGDLNCYPASFTSARNKFFSPGLCPNGWYSASSVTGTGALVSIASESNALCCPSGFQAIEPSNGPDRAGNTIFCGRVVDSILTNVYSTSTLDIGPLPEDYTTSTLDVAKISIRPTIWAEMIQVRWQATDTVVLSLQAQEARSATSTSIASTSSTSSVASASASTTAPAPATSTSVPVPNEPVLSTGAKAGIGIGIAALALLLVVAALLVFRRRKKPASQLSNIPLVPPQSDELKKRSHVVSPTELDGRYNQTWVAPRPHYREVELPA